MNFKQIKNIFLCSEYAFDLLSKHLYFINEILVEHILNLNLNTPNIWWKMLTFDCFLFQNVFPLLSSPLKIQIVLFKICELNKRINVFYSLYSLITCFKLIFKFTLTASQPASVNAFKILTGKRTNFELIFGISSIPISQIWSGSQNIYNGLIDIIHVLNFQCINAVRVSYITYVKRSEST